MWSVVDTARDPKEIPEIRPDSYLTSNKNILTKMQEI